MKIQSKNLAKLKKEKIRIVNEINTIKEEQVDKFQIPRLKGMIGQCFSYRNNNYGGDSGRWDVFRKIIDWVHSKERGFYFVFSF